MIEFANAVFGTPPDDDEEEPELEDTDDDEDDDEELDETPEDVIAMLGFDPAEDEETE